MTCEVPAETKTDNSVVLASGQFIWRLPLLSLGALGAGTWGFGLNYLSGTPVEGILGKHFNFTQNSHLVIYDDGDVDLITAQSTLQRFLYNSTTGKYSSEINNTRAQLTRRNAGTPNDEFVLVSASGNTSVFFGVGATIKTPGRIKSLTDRYGNRQTFTWFATPTQVLLTSVTDSYGRTVSYRYYGSELFFRLREIEDFTARRINFQYDTFGRLVAVITPSVLRSAPGNTFEGGTAYVFQYDIANRRPERRDDLIRIWYPNQATRFIDPASRTINVQDVYDAGDTAPPRYTIAYGQDPTDVDQYGRVTAQTVGDTNGTVGGTYLFQYSSQWDDINITNPFTDPVNQIVSRTVVTDRNGNQTEWHFNGNDMPVRKRVIATRNKSSLQGPDYITWTKFSERNQRLVVILPEGNSVTNEYDDGQVTGVGFFAPRMGQLKSTKRKLGNDYGIPVSTERSQPSNGQTELTQRFFYEPIFSGICATIEERGNPINQNAPPNNYFDPQNGTGTGFPKPDDADRSRYASFTYRDYQKNTDATITSDPTLQALLGLNATQIQALIDHVNNQMTATDGTGGLPAGFERDLGDINGDGTGNGDSSGLPTARQHGDAVMVKHPSVRLIGATAITAQDRVEAFTSNDRGQTTTHTDPEGNVTAFVRYPLADPDGEGVFQEGNSTDPNFETDQFRQYGRTKEVHVDVDPNEVMSLIGERGDLLDFVPKITRTNTPNVYQDLVTRYEGTSLGGGCASCAYDPLGNPLAVTNPRGFTTHYDRNELGEAFRVTSPEPYSYQTETYFDANRNVVRVDSDDKVVQYDSDDPSAAGYAHFTPTGGGSTAHVPTKAGPGGLVRSGWFTNLYTFDLLDNVVQEDIDATGANPANLITGFEYDGNENRTKVIKPEGNTVEFDYDERDLLIATRVGYDPEAETDESVTTVNVYDKNGNLLDVIGPAKRGGAGNSLSVIIEDAFGSGETMLHTGDWLVENVYDGFDRVVKGIDAVGNTANSLLDPGGRVVQATRNGPVGGATPINRNGAANQLLASSVMRFDEAGRQYEAEQHVLLATGTTILSGRSIFHVGGGLVPNSNANNHTGSTLLNSGASSYVLTRTVYDRASRATNIIGDLVKPTNLLSMTTLEYDGAGRRIATVDALGNRVDFTYDASGNVIGMVRTEFCTITQTPAIDSESFASAMHYDSLDRLVIQADQGPDGILNTDLSAANNETLFTRFGYDSRGNTTLLVDPKGNSSITILDGASRPYQTSQHLRDKGQGENPPTNNQTFLPGSGATVLTTSILDGNSRVTQLVDDRGNVTEFDYDLLDRQTVMTFQDGSTRTSVYDQASDVVVYTDENGSIFDGTFDPIGRRTACAISPAAGVIGTTSQEFQYDGLSRLTLARDFIGATSVDVALRYDSLGRVLEDSQTVGGNRRDVTNNQFTSYPVTTFTFPDNRQLTNVYDLLYRRTNVSETTGGANIAAWQFFGPGRVAEVQLGPTGATNLYCTYMNNARTHSAVQDGLTNPGWGSAGTDRLGYDGAGRMIAKRFLYTALSSGAYASTTPKVGFTTAFDAASNKLYERELHAPSRSHLYQPFAGVDLPADGGYDSLDRLRSYQRGTLSDGSGGANPAPAGGSIVAGQSINVATTNTQQSYDLDGLGNWKKTVFMPVGGASTPQHRDHNGLNQIAKLKQGGGSTPLAYDKSGNLTNDGTRTYKWDALNRLKEVYKTPATPVKIADYAYDAFGRRVRKVVSNGGLNNDVPNDQLDYVYSGWRCVEERDVAGGTNTPRKQYIWGIYLDELIQQKNLVALNDFAADAELYPLQDLLYRTTGLADTGGVIREAYDTDAYGNTLIFRNAGSPPAAITFANNDPQVAYATCDFIFTGQRWDAETGLYWYKMRYYLRTLGRFIGRDPLPLWQANLYDYTGENPAGWLDPYGFAVMPSWSNSGETTPNQDASTSAQNTSKPAKCSYDEKHAKCGCRMSKSCLENLVCFMKLVREIGCRLREDFTVDFWMDALLNRPRLQTWLYTSGRQAWNNHVTALENAFNALSRCAEVLARQKDAGLCGCLDWTPFDPQAFLKKMQEDLKGHMPIRLPNSIAEPIPPEVADYFPLPPQDEAPFKYVAPPPPPAVPTPKPSAFDNFIRFLERQIILIQ